ncbi:MAG: GTPase HflX [Phycisphaerae bacterium]|nr:GTPase HflX [Phycisphaerae bacterium]
MMELIDRRMQEGRRGELSVQAERALLVSVLLPGSPPWHGHGPCRGRQRHPGGPGTSADPMDPVGELRSLARTAGAEVVDEMVVRRREINAALYVGTGKAQEIAERVQRNGVDVVVFDNDLSPAQIRDLEGVVGRKVVDRSELILDIFAAHARTAESRLQVELAQLEYTYPRLAGMWTHLERVVGGSATAAGRVGGIGTRGPGERQIEIDRRLVQKRVVHLKRQIDAIDRRKVRQVTARKDIFRACLVGYTNAGKSTLMNLLTDAGALVADKLFATLDTRTRRWNAGDGQALLLSDTVGFVRDLPHHLVASFRATLEEAIHADLLLHVADASHDRVQQQIAAVEVVLEELGCDRARQLLVLNKIDRITDPAIFAVLRGKYPGGMFLSAVTGQGAAGLASEVARRAAGEPVRVTLRANCANGRLMQYIARHARIHSRSFSDATAVIDADLPAQRIAQLRRFGNDVHITCHEA